MQIHLASTKKVYKITSKRNNAKFLNGNGGAILDIKSSYVKYVKYDKKFKENYYKYYYSSRKIVKVKQ